MDGTVQFNGLLGGLIFSVTVVLLFLSAFVSMSLCLFGKRRDVGSSWRQSVLFSTIILLLFDGLYYHSVLRLQEAWTRESGSEFDSQMIFIWIPCHILGFFLLLLIARKGLSLK